MSNYLLSRRMKEKYTWNMILLEWARLHDSHIINISSLWILQVILCWSKQEQSDFVWLFVRHISFFSPFQIIRVNGRAINKTQDFKWSTWINFTNKNIFLVKSYKGLISVQILNKQKTMTLRALQAEPIILLSNQTTKLFL